MSTVALAEATAPTVANLSAAFMLDMDTYAVGGAAGFDGIAFYAAGRGGVLGEVTADVVTAAFVFFHPETVRTYWDGSADVMPRLEAAQLFADCAVTWAGNHLGDDVDWPRLVELAGRIVATAPIAGAPVVAGWNALPVPEDPKAAALHHLNGLRELRMARHGSAVLAVGLDVGDAVRHRSPGMVPIFGYEGLEVGDHVPALWDEAEVLTNRATAVDYAVLDDAEGAEFTDLCAAATAAVT